MISFISGIVNRFFIILFAMIISATTTFAQSLDDWGEVFGGSQTPKSNNVRTAQKPAVVVGAVGQDPKPGLRKALETQIKEAFVKDGRYTAVTREEAVLTAVDNEQAHQRTGAVDDAQVRQIGKQSGAKYVCVVEIAPLMNSYTLSAQFVDIESANIVSMASVTNMLRNPGDFLAASEELVRKLLGYEQKPSAVTDKKVPIKHVAVIETKIDVNSEEAKGISSADLGEITTVLRREAVKNLPKDKFKVMTSETVQSMGSAMVEDCSGETCIVTIGSKIGADYIVRGTLSKIRERYSLTVELFETEYGNLVAVTPSPIRSADLDELLDKSESVCADMYKSFVGIKPQATIPAPAPAPKPEPVPVARPEPVVPPPTSIPTYTLTVKSNPLDGGAIKRVPNYVRYEAGTKVTITAEPADGYVFTGWTRASSNYSIMTVTMNSDMTLTANFRAVKKNKPESQDKRTRIGVRTAFNISDADICLYYVSNGQLKEDCSDIGPGFELGIVTSTHISRFWSFRSGGNFIFRHPVVFGRGYLNELGIAVPAFIRLGGRSQKFAFFIETGPQFDITISDIEERNRFDVGYAAGAGFTIGRHIEIDGRFVYNMLDYIDISSIRGRNQLLQYSFGLTYMIGGKR